MPFRRSGGEVGGGGGGSDVAGARSSMVAREGMQGRPDFGLGRGFARGRALALCLLTAPLGVELRIGGSISRSVLLSVASYRAMDYLNSVSEAVQREVSVTLGRRRKSFASGSTATERRPSFVQPPPPGAAGLIAKESDVDGWDLVERKAPEPPEVSIHHFLRARGRFSHPDLFLQAAPGNTLNCMLLSLSRSLAPLSGVHRARRAHRADERVVLCRR